MKSTRLIALAALALAFAACHHGPFNEKEIRTNALGYLQAVGDYHIDEAIPYCTRHTQEKTLPTFRFLLDHSDTAYINSNRPSVFTIYTVHKLSDTTASVLYHKSTPIQETDDSLVLVYEEGRWLADVHIGPIPYISNIMAGPRPVSELPRPDTMVYHKVTSVPKSLVNRQLPDSLTKQ